MKKNIINIVTENPVLARNLGLVSILFASKNLKAALMMSLTVCLIMLIISITNFVFKNIIDKNLENIILVIYVAGLATIAQLLIEFYTPDVALSMDLGISLIAVNSILIYRKSSNKIVNFISYMKSLFYDMVGYTLVIILLASIREFLGQGSIFGILIYPKIYTISIFSTPIMAFILIGLFIAFSNWLDRKIKLGGRYKWNYYI